MPTAAPAPPGGGDSHTHRHPQALGFDPSEGGARRLRDARTLTGLIRRGRAQGIPVARGSSRAGRARLRGGGAWCAAIKRVRSAAAGDGSVVSPATHTGVAAAPTRTCGATTTRERHGRSGHVDRAGHALPPRRAPRPPDLRAAAAVFCGTAGGLMVLPGVGRGLGIGTADAIITPAGGRGHRVPRLRGHSDPPRPDGPLTAWWRRDGGAAADMDVLGDRGGNRPCDLVDAGTRQPR